MQNLQVLLDGPRRPCLFQHVGSHPEPCRGKKLLPGAVMFEGARLAYQPVDDMTVVDLMAVFAPQPRDPVHFRLTVQDPQTLTGKPDRHLFADQAARNGVGVVGRPDRRGWSDADLDLPKIIQPPLGGSPQDPKLFFKTGLPTPSAPRKDQPKKSFISLPGRKIAAPAH